MNSTLLPTTRETGKVGQSMERALMSDQWWPVSYDPLHGQLTFSITNYSLFGPSECLFNQFRRIRKQTIIQRYGMGEIDTECTC
jgi:hypothetical protein